MASNAEAVRMVPLLSDDEQRDFNGAVIRHKKEVWGQFVRRKIPKITGRPPFTVEQYMAGQIAHFWPYLEDADSAYRQNHPVKVEGMLDSVIQQKARLAQAFAVTRLAAVLADGYAPDWIALTDYRDMVLEALAELATSTPPGFFSSRNIDLLSAEDRSQDKALAKYRRIAWTYRGIILADMYEQGIYAVGEEVSRLSWSWISFEWALEEMKKDYFSNPRNRSASKKKIFIFQLNLLQNLGYQIGTPQETERAIKGLWDQYRGRSRRKLPPPPGEETADEETRESASGEETLNDGGEGQEGEEESPQFHPQTRAPSPSTTYDVRYDEKVAHSTNPVHGAAYTALKEYIIMQMQQRFPEPVPPVVVGTSAHHTGASARRERSTPRQTASSAGASGQSSRAQPSSGGAASARTVSSRTEEQVPKRRREELGRIAPSSPAVGPRASRVRSSQGLQVDSRDFPSHRSLLPSTARSSYIVRDPRVGPSQASLSFSAEASVHNPLGRTEPLASSASQLNAVVYQHSMYAPLENVNPFLSMEFDEGGQSSSSGLLSAGQGQGQAGQEKPIAMEDSDSDTGMKRASSKRKIVSDDEVSEQEESANATDAQAAQTEEKNGSESQEDDAMDDAPERRVLSKGKPARRIVSDSEGSAEEEDEEVQTSGADNGRSHKNREIRAYIEHNLEDLSPMIQEMASAGKSYNEMGLAIQRRSGLTFTTPKTALHILSELFGDMIGPKKRYTSLTGCLQSREEEVVLYIQEWIKQKETNKMPVSCTELTESVIDHFDVQLEEQGRTKKSPKEIAASAMKRFLKKQGLVHKLTPNLIDLLNERRDEVDLLIRQAYDKALQAGGTSVTPIIGAAIRDFAREAFKDQPESARDFRTPTSARHFVETSLKRLGLAALRAHKQSNMPAFLRDSAHEAAIKDFILTHASELAPEARVKGRVWPHYIKESFEKMASDLMKKDCKFTSDATARTRLHVLYDRYITKLPNGSYALKA